MENIKMMKLLNGDNIICGEIRDVLPEENDWICSLIKIKKPFILKNMFVKDGPVLIPMELLPSDDEWFTIPKTAIAVLPCNPSKDLITEYLKMTSSIVIANPNLSKMI